MNQIKTLSKLGNVPFSWEKKPGVSKVKTDQDHHQYLNEGEVMVIKLPPPPCPIESPRVSTHDLNIPLPPCTFQPPSRSSSRKGGLRDDPFLAAYKECTKSTRNNNKGYNYKLLSKKLDGGSTGSGLRKGMFNLSCKNSCSVRDDNLVRVSQFPS